MEILGILLLIGVVFWVGMWALAIGVVAWIFLSLFWPLILGIIGGIFIWIYWSDNAGVIFALVCFVGQFFWGKYVDPDTGGSYSGDSATRGKIRHYNKDGELTGYSDKD